MEITEQSKQLFMAYANQNESASLETGLFAGACACEETSEGTVTANARLIAAAPELLTAAKYAVDLIDVLEESIDARYRTGARNLRAAIAAAEGLQLA